MQDFRSLPTSPTREPNSSITTAPTRTPTAGSPPARGLHRGPAGERAVRSSATRQALACGPPEIVGAPYPPRLRGRSASLPLRRAMWHAGKV